MTTAGNFLTIKSIKEMGVGSKKQVSTVGSIKKDAGLS
jgi:hypothetical protein